MDIYFYLNWYYVMPISKETIQKIIIVIIIFVVILVIYNFTYKSKYGGYISNVKISDVPYAIKCAFEEPGCEEGNIDGWTLVHGIMYFIIGLFVPNRFLVILVISIIWELLQPLMGNSARFIINPLVNLTGYAIGSLVRDNYSKSQLHEKYSILES